MAIIFALQGIHDVGKTTTLRELINLIATLKGVTPAIKPQTRGDVQAVFTGVSTKIGKVNVGVETRGDDASNLKSDVNNLFSASCEIIFCACRSGGGTVAYLESLKNPHTVNFIGKPSDATAIRASENTRIAQFLYDFL